VSCYKCCRCLQKMQVLQVSERARELWLSCKLKLVPAARNDERDWTREPLPRLLVTYLH
jgi:hypothetical protein